jgi:hypothetical protein
LINSIEKDRGTPNKSYNLFYAAMKEWGRYELVASPEDADLVFEIYASAPVVSSKGGESKNQPQLQLSIFDPKTHFLLWKLTEALDATGPGPFGGVGGIAHKERFYATVSGIIDQLKSLTTPTTPPPNK